MKRRATTFVLATTVLLAASYAPSAAGAVPAQSSVDDEIDDEIEDGVYVGTVSLHGGYYISVGDSGGGVRIDADIDGEAQLIAQDGVVDGLWSYVGTGSGQIEVFGVSADAVIDFTGDGTFTGTNTAARVEGNTMFTGTVTAGGTTQPLEDSAPTDQPLENVLAGCGQIVGTYTLRINEDIEATVDGQSFIRAVVALYSEPQTSVADQLAKRATELLAEPIRDPSARIRAAKGLLNEVQPFQAELNATSSCPSAKEHFNLLTNVAADLVAETLEALGALQDANPSAAAKSGPDVLDFLLEMGVSTGATGAGAVGGRGAELLPAMREAAQQIVDLNIEGQFDFDRLVQLAGLSVRMGWNLSFGFVTDVDVLLTGGDPDDYLTPEDSADGEGE